MRIRRVRVELFHANGQTDGMKNGRTDGHTDRETDVTKPNFLFEVFQTRLKCHFLE